MQGFAYRGFMLDSSRHFIPPADVRKLISAARICGMNRMHWHLTDDQGWRIEIRKYPRLTSVGAFRGRTFFGGVSETENNSGFYTQEEIREIVRFAGENGMEVIPEIEIPGHASALLAAYPEAGCRREAVGQETKPWPYAVEISGGIFPNLICGGKESALRFMEDVLDEVTELFPGRMVHIGGDEALKLHWRRCPDCRERMRKLGLRDEDELQRDLVLRIGAYLAEKGKETIVWNDVLKGGMLPGHFIVQQWMDGEDRTRRFMENGGRVICSENKAYYFDYPYGRINVRTIWQHPRIPDWAKGFETQLLGLECPLWTERVTNLDRAAYMLFPRLAAAGLKADPEELPWEEFLEKVRDSCRKIGALGLKCAPEEWWDPPKDRAEEDIRADHDRIYAPEALPFVEKQQQWIDLDEEERRKIREGRTKASVLREGDRMLETITG